MSTDTYDHSHELEMALLTAENHGDAYRLVSSPDACRRELVKVIRRHHSDINEIDAEVVAQKVLVQWQTDRSEEAAAWVKTNSSILVDQLTQLAYQNGLKPAYVDDLADGTIHLRFGGSGLDRYISATIDPEGASLDVGGFIGDHRAGIQIEDVEIGKHLPRRFTITVDEILKA